jgi:hypothetical protein
MDAQNRNVTVLVQLKKALTHYYTMLSNDAGQTRLDPTDRPRV